MSNEEKQAMNTDVEQEASTPVVAAAEPAAVVVAEKAAEPAVEPPKADPKAEAPATSSITVSSETKTTKPKKQLCFPKVTAHFAHSRLTQRPLD